MLRIEELHALRSGHFKDQLSETSPVAAVELVSRGFCSIPSTDNCGSNGVLSVVSLFINYTIIVDLNVSANDTNSFKYSSRRSTVKLFSSGGMEKQLTRIT